MVLALLALSVASLLAPSTTTSRHVFARSRRILCTEPPETRDARAWVQRAVIGLNMCPFARPAWDQLRFAQTDADVAGLYTVLQDEIAALLAPGSAIETTLLVCPNAPANYMEFSGFLANAGVAMQMQGVASELQVVGFHPRFVYTEPPHEPWEPAEAEAEDPCSYTNRSPVPMIHLLRQSSVRQAATSHPDSRDISVANERLLRELGVAHMRELLVGRAADRAGD